MTRRSLLTVSTVALFLLVFAVALPADEPAGVSRTVILGTNSVWLNKNVQVGDDAIGYIISQLIEAFLHSGFVEEVFDEDNDLRKKIKPVLHRHMSMDEQLDREVREKIKNMEEGSASWDIEYQKVMDNIKRTKKIDS